MAALQSFPSAWTDHHAECAVWLQHDRTSSVYGLIDEKTAVYYVCLLFGFDYSRITWRDTNEKIAELKERKGVLLRNVGMKYLPWDKALCAIPDIPRHPNRREN
ncbi:MAG: hypothetical protein M1830_008676 [Pleopsidium flavum]|nr:MAG: hypothetical protein M1830_008676 [Pleopsidium flavum]